MPAVGRGLTIHEIFTRGVGCNLENLEHLGCAELVDDFV